MQGRRIYRHLYFQVLAAIAIGILLGYFYPEKGAEMKPLGDGFIKLIKMIIAPIIFCTVVTGIAGMEDMKKVGRVGAKALLYFEVVSTVALAIGLLVVSMVRPGVGDRDRCPESSRYCEILRAERARECAEEIPLMSTA